MPVRVLHAAELDADTGQAVRELLDEAFAGGFDDQDWDHALGGLHVLAHDRAGTLVGHAAVVRRSLVHGRRALRAGYVEAVGVLPAARERGHGAALMAEVERIARAAYELGALSATDAAIGFYAGRGWLPWTGPLATLSPRGPRPTPDDEGSVLVLPVAGVPLDPAGPLSCDWRAGDPW